MKQKERISPPAIGGSSLLVIFAVLCLTVFAILSVSTANRDRILSDKMADSVAGYYEADCEAEAILAGLRSGTVPEGTEVKLRDESGTVYFYICRVSETQNLEAEVKVSEGGGYEILRWQLVSSVNWEADEDINVWDGGEPWLN